jgi:hypothetical protein
MRLALHRPSRPLWLITLADLSLLLVGFFVFLQATGHKSAPQQAAISAGIREAFGGEAAPRLAVEANAVLFAAGSAAAPDLAPIRSWARDALADPRTRLVVTGYADPGEGVSLAGARADAVLQGLADIRPERLRAGAALLPGARRVTLTISYDP